MVKTANIALKRTCITLQKIFTLLELVNVESAMEISETGTVSTNISQAEHSIKNCLIDFASARSFFEGHYHR